MNSRAKLKISPSVLTDQLLCQRKTEGLSLEEMASNALQLCIDPAQVQRVVENYRQMVYSTGFDDFGPVKPELLATPPSRDKG